MQTFAPIGKYPIFETLYNEMKEQGYTFPVPLKDEVGVILTPPPNNADVSTHMVALSLSVCFCIRVGMILRGFSDQAVRVFSALLFVLCYQDS